MSRIEAGELCERLSKPSAASPWSLLLNLVSLSGSLCCGVLRTSGGNLCSDSCVLVGDPSAFAEGAELPDPFLLWDGAEGTLAQAEALSILAGELKRCSCSLSLLDRAAKHCADVACKLDDRAEAGVFLALGTLPRIGRTCNFSRGTSVWLVLTL